MAKWLHTRKGVIEGELVSDDGIWTMIRFKGDQNLRSTKPGAMLPFADGEVITVRTSLLKVLTED